MSTLNSLTAKRMLLREELASHCISNYDGCYDLARAKDFLRSYVCLFYDLLKKDYSDKITIWDWEQQIAEEAIHITLKVWSLFEVGPPASDWVETLRSAVIQHVGRPLKTHGAPVQLLPPSAYTASSSLLAMVVAASPAARPHPARLSSQVTSPSAARKMEAFMETNGLNQTEFAIQANTSDKTIRKFRQTGKVKRSILTGIASAMGTTKEELLKQ